MIGAAAGNVMRTRATGPRRFARNSLPYKFARNNQLCYKLSFLIKPRNLTLRINKTEPLVTNSIHTSTWSSTSKTILAGLSILNYVFNFEAPTDNILPPAYINNHSSRKAKIHYFYVHIKQFTNNWQCLSTPIIMHDQGNVTYKGIRKVLCKQRILCKAPEIFNSKEVHIRM